MSTEKNDLDSTRRDALDYLTDCYARSVLDLRGYEDRRDQVLAARTSAEVQRVVNAIDGKTEGSGVGNRKRSKPPAPAESGQSAVCIMGDRKLVPNVIPPGGISTTCIMGDVVIDLRQCTFSEAARIHTVTIMGDTVIRVPDNVTVHNSINAIMSDVKDKHAPRESNGPVVYLTGAALMADVKIRRG